MTLRRRVRVRPLRAVSSSTPSPVCDPPIWAIDLGSFPVCGAGNNGQAALDKRDKDSANLVEIGTVIPVGAKTTGQLRRNAMRAEYGGERTKITTNGTTTRKGRRHSGKLDHWDG